jgi:hypothetical protein
LKRNNGVSKLLADNQPGSTAPDISNNSSNNNPSSNQHGLAKLPPTMSAEKLQKSLFESAKRLKTKGILI